MRKKIHLSCAACGSRNYSTHKNDAHNERLEARKYCKWCEKHTIHKETK